MDRSDRPPLRLAAFAAALVLVFVAGLGLGSVTSDGSQDPGGTPATTPTTAPAPSTHDHGGDR